MATDAALPIDAVLTDISDALRRNPRLVLAAPPGAGKTTRVPLHLLKTIMPAGQRVVMLQPRRIAARGAANRMAEMLGERLGDTIGLSTRLERRVSPKTRIEVITDGLFTRRILADPELSSIGAVIFDEVHERRLSSDLGLALALDAQSALRDDLLIIAMSATLDTARMSGLLNAETVESEGRAYPIDTTYLGRPRDRLADGVTKAVLTALREDKGSILTFLPGVADIRRVADLLSTQVPSDVDVYPLFGALSPAEQDAAIRPASDGRRKVVLSTDIAESALTIEGVSAVVDAGLVRVPIEVPGARAARLETQRASRASVDQRRGRAGRTGPGRCYRLWDEAETRGLSAEIRPEILSTDLSTLLIALADWGEDNPANLTWLDPPPPGKLAAAKQSLQQFCILDASGALTPLGREVSQLPLPPHLAVLICNAETPGERALGADIAALLSERGLGGQSTDLDDRLRGFRSSHSVRAKALRDRAKQWGGGATASRHVAHLIAKSWPDAIARRRKGEGSTYLMASGEAARLDPDDRLAKAEWIVVADSIGSAKGVRISLATPIEEANVLKISPPELAETAKFDPKTGKFTARRVSKIGAIILNEQPLPKPSGEAARQALADALADHGFDILGAGELVHSFCRRLEFARSINDKLPDWTMTALASTALEWLLFGPETLLPKTGDVAAALETHLGWDLTQTLNELAPKHLRLPNGRNATFDWLDEKAPLVEARVQEVYGLIDHPTAGQGRTPVTLSLLSPAGRPVAITRDISSFWRGGYIDMAKDMRARYPKHDWPDDPATAKPHEGRTKARLARD